jgi:osmotically-inducible protein OsmY
MTDTLLRQNIIDELDFEPGIDATHIGVAVTDGVVTLTGHVASYLEQYFVEQAVRRVKGVRAIAEEIEVRYPGDNQTADDEIATRAFNVLRWSAVVPQTVQVKVQKGLLTLSGEVDWQFERNAAESELRNLNGVTGVINNIALRPRVQTQDVKRKIEDALKRSATVEAQRIRVSVLDGGKVSLEGYAHDWRERDAVERAAWSAPGVTSVIDRIAIG